MRKDMKKVLCERPRHYRSYSYHDFRRAENRGDYDDLPARKSMTRPYMFGYDYHAKQFSDLIGPLRGYLRSCVGRLWNEVWSEICQNVPSGNTVDRHLRDHVLWEVETQTFLVDDEVFVLGRYGREPYKPDGLYVDPRDGILRKAAETPRKKRHYRHVDGFRYEVSDNDVLFPVSFWNNEHVKHPRKIIAPEKEVIQIDGIWYWVVFADVPPPYLYRYKDTSGETKEVIRNSAKRDWVTGKVVQSGRYRAGKVQMSSRDLRRYGLKNN